MSILPIETINKEKASLTQIMLITCFPIKEILTVILLSLVILLGTKFHASATQAFKTRKSQ